MEKKIKFFIFTFLLLVILPVVLFAQSFNELVSEFAEAHKSKNYSDQVRTLTTILEKYPDKTPELFYKGRGDAYYWLKDYTKSIEDYSIAITIKPDYALAISFRGNAYLNINEYTKAIKDYTTAIVLDPSFEKVYNNRGLAYFKIGEFNKAIEDFTDAIKIKTDFIESYINRGNAYSQSDDFNKAIADFTKAISINSKYSLAYFFRGTTFYYLEDYYKAADDFKSAINIDPEYKIYLSLALTQYALGDMEEAKKYMNEVIKTEPRLTNGMEVLEKLGIEGGSFLDVQKLELEKLFELIKK